MLREIECADLPDARLKERLDMMVDRLSATPGQSLPQACGSWPDTKAAYRFLG